MKNDCGGATVDAAISVVVLNDIDTMMYSGKRYATVTGTMTSSSRGRPYPWRSRRREAGRPGGAVTTAVVAVRLAVVLMPRPLPDG
ncbi:hypothetical protein GCM10022262_35070 [Georgenia daeguensis]|uniref:Uncharacterized protein n=1 Tax=Georgenia daeguensis TaxID=908355 RepID=A0ABP8EYS7_9MICO